MRADSFTHRDELYDDIPCESGCDPMTGTPVTVTAGSSTPGIDFALRRMGSISGALTNAGDGTPIAFERVTAFGSTGQEVASGFSDGQGAYTIFPLDEGSHFVRTSTFTGWADELYDNLPCAVSCTVTDGTAVPVFLGVDTTGIDFALTAPGSISGRVTAADTGQELTADILVFDDNGAFLFGHFGVSGSYLIHDLGSSSYHLVAHPWHSGYESQLYADLGCDPECDAAAGTPVVVSTEVMTSGIDFALRPCSLSSRNVVAGVFVFGTQIQEACRTVLVGPDVTVAGSGRLVLRAGESVVFGDGFSVQSGGRLEVTIDPQVGGFD